MRRMALIVFASLALAGCTSPESSLDALAPPPDAPGVPVEVPFNETFAWRMSAGVGTPIVTLNGGPLVGDSSFAGVRVPAGAQQMTITAEGTCATAAACELLLRASGERDHSVQGPLPLAIAIEGPGAGAWQIGILPAFGTSVVAGASGTITITGTAIQ